MNKPVERRMAEIVSMSWKKRGFRSCLGGDNASITLEAPVFDVSGYATTTRSLLKGLMVLDTQVAINHRWFKGAVDVRSHTAEVLNEDYIVIRDQDDNLFKYCLWITRNDVEEILYNSYRQSAKDQFVIHMAPFSNGCDHFEVARQANPEFKSYIGSTMFETNLIPEDWVTSCNKMDYIWVPSAFNIETFSNSGVDYNKIIKVPLGVDTILCQPGLYPRYNDYSDSFVFLSVFEWDYRKGWDILLKAFCCAFSKKDSVTLIIKSSSAKKNVQEMVFKYLESEGLLDDNTPEIVVIEKKINSRELYSLYESCDAFVLPTRGEGWGMPYLEAMAFGKPVIGTNWGGNTEFMTQENSFLIESDGEENVSKEQLEDNVCFVEGHKYASPSLDNLIELMKTVSSSQEIREKVAKKGFSDAHTRWNHIEYAKNALQALKKCQ